MEKKKILLLYTDRYYLIKQVYPFGLDLIADYLRGLGHQVTIDYPFLPYTDLEINLKNLLENRDLIVMGYSGSDDYDISELLVSIKTNRKIVWINHSNIESLFLWNQIEKYPDDSLEDIPEPLSYLLYQHCIAEAVKSIP